MRTELAAVSYLCVGLLALLSPVFLHTRNVAVISLATWLFVCSLIHGINTMLWAGNDDVHAPVWCDIVTRVLLASQLALPGCALALARGLRRCAIGQEIVQKAYTVMQDLTFCLIIPLIYVVLHVIVQPHRFDITTDFGCSASIYTSSVSVILIWSPPLIFCITTFVYAFLAVRSRLEGGLVFFSHMQDSPRLNIFTFLRPLLTSFLIAAISLSTTIYTIYARVSAIGGLQTWSVDTWNGVHAHMTEIFVVPPTSHLDLVRTEVEWWVVLACSFVLIAMTVLGLIYRAMDDSSRGYQILSRWFRSKILGQPVQDPLASSSSSKALRPHMLSSTPSSPTLVGDRKSLYEDVWAPSAPAKMKLAKLARLAIPEVPQSSSLSCNSPDPEDPFVKSTLTYIESPTGREALGLPPLPPALFSSPQPQMEALGLPSSPFPPPPTKYKAPVRPPRPDSILSAPWPLPPLEVPTSPRTPSPKNSFTPINVLPPSPPPAAAGDDLPVHSRPPSIMSITTSLASSTISMSAYGIYDEQEPHVVPFQEYLSTADVDAAGSRLAVPRHVRRARSRDGLLPIPRAKSGRARRQGSDGLSGGIYMTVVKETEAV